MKSRVSCFNRGVSRSLLRRCWPLWAGYGVLLLFLLPVQLARAASWRDETTAQTLQRLTLESADAMVLISFFMGILTAMIVFAYLYNPRSCGLMHSLPLRRETLFGTAWLTGFLPMLAAALLTALLSAALYLGRGLLPGDLLLWLLATVCADLCFYGIGVFCAMLTGSLLMLPIAYLALNLAAWALEACLRVVLRALVYGINTQGEDWFSWLSPVVWLSRAVYVARPESLLGWKLFGALWLPVYGAVGLLLSGLALLLYRRRHLERAGDTLAFPVLKPIFRWCLALGGALASASAVYSLLLGGSLHGRRAALLLLGLLLLGAALGWYAAEMLIRRTVRVFPGKWKGLAVLCALLCLLCLSAEFDLMGFERRVPEPEEVESLRFSAQGEWTLTEEENLRQAVALHRSLVEHKSIHEPEIHYYGDWLTLHYELKNGRSLERSYFLRCEQAPEPGDLDALEDLLNCPELLERRGIPSLPVTESTVYAAQFSWVTRDEAGWEQYEARSLSREEALDFYRSAVLPDRQEHSLGRLWLRSDGRRLDRQSTLSFQLELSSPEGFDWLELEIDMDSRHCLDWVREHTEIPVQSLREIYGEGEEFPLADAEVPLPAR